MTRASGGEATHPTADEPERFRVIDSSASLDATASQVRAMLNELVEAVA